MTFRLLKKVLRTDTLYEISRESAKKLLAKRRGIFKCECKLCNEFPATHLFTRHKDGSAKIGCTTFTPEQVERIRKWADS